MEPKFVEVKTEYTNDKDLKKDDVQALIDWVRNQPHLPNINEFQAIVFLKKCYYRIEAAKTTIDSYFTVKRIWSDISWHYDLENPPLKGMPDVLLCTVLPKKTPEGYIILFMKVLRPEFNNYNVNLVFKYMNMAALLDLYQKGISEGYVIVFDMQDYPYNYLSKLEFLTFKRYFYYLQEIMPTRFKGIHYFNPVSFMDEIMALVDSSTTKPFLPLIRVHKSLKDLCKYVPIKCLPRNYGGSADPVDVLQEKTKSNMLKNDAFFKWEDQQVVDEDKRPSGSKSASCIFGAENRS